MMERNVQIDPELQAILEQTRSLDGMLQSTEGQDPLELDKDPAFVADLMKGMLLEDILRAMDELKISKTELAIRMGKSKQYVGRILNETANFTLATVAELACALGRRAQARIYDKSESMNVAKITRIDDMSIGDDSERDSRFYHAGMPYLQLVCFDISGQRSAFTCKFSDSVRAVGDNKFKRAS